MWHLHPGSHLHAADVQVRALRHQNVLRITEAAALAAITIVIMIVLSWSFGTCVEVPEWLENGYGITFHCPDGMQLTLHDAVRVSIVQGNDSTECASESA